MFNSVFKKMTLVYFIIILISFAILGVALAKVFENYYFEQRTQALIEEGQKLNSTIIDYLNDDVSYQRLALDLQSIERYLNTKIWVIDKTGTIYGVSSISEENWIGKQVSTKDVIEVYKGNTVTNRGEYDQVFGGPVLTVGIPIYVNGIVLNAVFMHSPIYEIREALYEVYKLIFTTLAISLIIASFLIYYATQRITKPLTDITKITKEIASGDFHKRLDIESKDEIGELSRSFNNMARELENIEMTRKGFIANVSHELRSPLTLIKGYIKGLMDDKLPEDKRRKYTNIIYEETERLSELISNLLDLSRMESGKYNLEFEEFDINELLRRNIIKFTNKLEEKNIDVEVNFLEDPLIVRGEKDSISQVIYNIIDNGIKFMSKDDGQKLMINTKLKGNKAIISIEDTGIGVAEEEIEDIWERFYKSDKSRSRQIKGTGLGLPIVKEILKAHNEDIWVESQVGKGSKFTFTLRLS